MRDALLALGEDPALAELGRNLTEFNIFEAAGRKPRRENLHSDILANLLHPRERHGFGDTFLCAFLRRLPISPVDLDSPVVVAALGETEVHRELDRADVFIVNRTLRFFVLIENKLDAGEHGDQLARYHASFRQRFPGHAAAFIFLSPEGGVPSHPDYGIMSYVDVALALDQTLAEIGPNSSEAAIYLRHYSRFVRRYVVDDDESARLAAEIRTRHAAALEFIMAAAEADGAMPPPRRGEESALQAALAELLSDYPQFTEDGHTRTIFRFVPKDWDTLPALCSGRRDGPHNQAWTGTGRVLLFEVKHSRDPSDRVALKLYIGPNSPEAAPRILQSAQEAGQPFAAPAALGKEWTCIWSGDPLPARPRSENNIAQVIGHVRKELERLIPNLPPMHAAMQGIHWPHE